MPAIASWAGEKLVMRVGVASGPAIGAVLGGGSPRWHLFGPAFVEAAALEHHGAPGVVRVSPATATRLQARQAARAAQLAAAVGCEVTAASEVRRGPAPAAAGVAAVAVDEAEVDHASSSSAHVDRFEVRGDAVQAGFPLPPGVDAAAIANAFGAGMGFFMVADKGVELASADHEVPWVSIERGWPSLTLDTSGSFTI